MAFDANKNIKIEAAQSESGTFTLRTAGLVKQKRAELEIVDVPEVALKAAAGILNLLATYTVDRAEVLAGQSVGNMLTAGDEGRPLLLAVRALAAQKAKGGFFAKLGGDKGVLRLVDVDAKDGAPRTAIATMLVHRAEMRMASDDRVGARAEIEAALEVLPGKARSGPAIGIADVDGTYNWQNHCAYLTLAEIAEHEGEEAEAAEHFAAALERSEELARREFGATCMDLGALEAAEVASEARKIIEHNLTKAAQGQAPSHDLATMPSPIWERTGGGVLQRRASLVPSSFVELYYEGAAASGLRERGPALVARILAGRSDPWSAAWPARKTRILWVSEEAPWLEALDHAHPMSGLVSNLLADVARAFRAGATDAEVLAHHGRGEAADETRASYRAKMAQLSEWESAGYIRALSDAM